MVPFSHQSRGGFAAGCKLSIAGNAVTTTIGERSILAESGPIDPGEIEVVLRTPELKGAGGDGRTVGLAIGVTGPKHPPMEPTG